MKATDFVKEIIFEGGNVTINGHNADRIDLTKLSRAKMVPILDQLLWGINQAYLKKFHTPLWSPKLISSKAFLSGSAYHFFDKNIPHAEFARIKPTVGDIDTQVDNSQKNNVETFLKSLQGQTIGPANFIGYKSSAGQYITLWEFANPPIKIQIDLELVEYANGEPTEWSQFSHSSSWNDLTAGIKGVFHKYLLRAFTTQGLRERWIESKTGKLKKVNSTDLAFSVAHGMREKYEPVLSSPGMQKFEKGLPVYREIPVNQSNYVNSTDEMFKLIFGDLPTTKEKKQFSSFIGGLELAKIYLDPQAKEKLITGFALTLYGPTAQQLYRNNPKEDEREKEIALNTMIKMLGMEHYYNTIEHTIKKNKENFYQSYKISESIKENQVVKSPRKGIEHLDKMSDLDFINFIKKIKYEMHGKLNPIRMTLKVDGLGARFGKDRDGRPFFESSSSGPIFKSGSFTAHAHEHGFTGERLERAIHYDDMYKLIVNSIFIKQLPNDTKVNCEILYNPMADEVSNGYKFVTLSYDKSKLGKVMTIIPFDSEVASTGQRHPRSEQIKDFLIKVKNEGGIKFIDDRLDYVDEIDLNAEIDPILSIANANFIAKLSSRLKIDAVEKKQIKAFLQAAKESLSKAILAHPGILGKEQLGKNIEGIILHRNDLSPIKITTPHFRDTLRAKRELKNVPESAI